MPLKVVHLASGTPQLPLARVDGADVVLPQEAAWRHLEEAAGVRLDGWPVGLLDLLAGWRWFGHARRPAFALAVYPPERGSAWLPFVLLRRLHGWQRVHIEYVRCDHCGWWGAIANPAIPDLYLGVPAQAAALAAAWALAPASCPVYDGPLPRRAIWTDGTPPDAS